MRNCVSGRMLVSLTEYLLSVSSTFFFPHSGIVQRWEVLQAQAVERQRQSSQVRELQRQVKNLRLSLEALGEQASELTKADDVHNRLKLIQKLQEAKVRFRMLLLQLFFVFTLSKIPPGYFAKLWNLK